MDPTGRPYSWSSQLSSVLFGASSGFPMSANGILWTRAYQTESLIASALDCWPVSLREWDSSQGGPQSLICWPIICRDCQEDGAVKRQSLSAGENTQEAGSSFHHKVTSAEEAVWPSDTCPILVNMNAHWSRAPALLLNMQETQHLHSQYRES